MVTIAGWWRAWSMTGNGGEGKMFLRFKELDRLPPFVVSLTPNFDAPH